MEIVIASMVSKTDELINVLSNYRKMTKLKANLRMS